MNIFYKPSFLRSLKTLPRPLFENRIIFMWEKQDESAILLAIGDHALYD